MQKNKSPRHKTPVQSLTYISASYFYGMAKKEKMDEAFIEDFYTSLGNEVTWGDSSHTMVSFATYLKNLEETAGYEEDPKTKAGYKRIIKSVRAFSRKADYIDMET